MMYPSPLIPHCSFPLLHFLSQPLPSHCSANHDLTRNPGPSSKSLNNHSPPLFSPETTMEPVADEAGSPKVIALTSFQQEPTQPIRILVQTKTHLVPGDEYAERVDRMRNLICQHHWNRDFDWNQDRWNVYGADFGFDDRNCYFLVDHGESPTDPPILWYSWTGESLLVIPGPLLTDSLIRLTSSAY